MFKNSQRLFEQLPKTTRKESDVCTQKRVLGTLVGDLWEGNNQLMSENTELKQENEELIEQCQFLAQKLERSERQNNELQEQIERLKQNYKFFTDNMVTLLRDKSQSESFLGIYCH